MKYRKSRRPSWRERKRESIEYFVDGLGGAIEDPVNRGYCALFACIMNCKITADDALKELKCL